MTRLFVLAIVFATTLLLSSPAANAIPPVPSLSPHWSEEHPPSDEDLLMGYAVGWGILLTLSAIGWMWEWMWDWFYYREIKPPGRPKPPWHRRFMELNLNAMKWLAPKILQNLIWEMGKWLLGFRLRRQHRPQFASATAPG